MKRSRFELINQDCLAWLPAQKAGSFQAFILDPPYNVGYRYGKYRDSKSPAIYLHEQMLVLAHCARLLKPGGSLFYLNYPEFAGDVWHEVDFLNRVKWITWVYHTHLGGTPLRRSSRAWLWFSKGEHLINQEAFRGEYRNPTDHRIRGLVEEGKRPVGLDWFDLEQVKNRNQEKRAHPCQVPEPMVEKFILGTTQRGDLVGDCYTGSGTTAICALRHGRQFSGCELDPGYVQVAREAVEALRKPDQADKETQFSGKAFKDPSESVEKVEIRRVI
jgi:adenine-specific DNA-methyltransferase